jgi:hypothetical protein
VGVAGSGRQLLKRGELVTNGHATSQLASGNADINSSANVAACDPHPARKGAPTTPFQGEVERAAGASRRLKRRARRYSTAMRVSKL